MGFTHCLFSAVNIWLHKTPAAKMILGLVSWCCPWEWRIDNPAPQFSSECSRAGGPWPPVQLWVLKGRGNTRPWCVSRAPTLSKRLISSVSHSCWGGQVQSLMSVIWKAKQFQLHCPLLSRLSQGSLSQGYCMCHQPWFHNWIYIMTFFLRIQVATDIHTLSLCIILTLLECQLHKACFLRNVKMQPLLQFTFLPF